MAETIITQNTMTVEIMLVWDGWHYFLTRVRPIGGKPEAKTAEQAAEIIRLNESEPGVEISTRGKVEIGSNHNWSWLAKIQVPINEVPA